MRGLTSSELEVIGLASGGHCESAQRCPTRLMKPLMALIARGVLTLLPCGNRRCLANRKGAWGKHAHVTPLGKLAIECQSASTKGWTL